MGNLVTAGTLTIDLRSFEIGEHVAIDLRSFEADKQVELQEVAEPVHRAWLRVMADWDDAARHAALLGLAAEHRCFAWVATRYRTRAGDPIADAQLGKLRRAVTAVMFAMATPRREAQKRNPLRSMVIVLTLAVVSAVGGAAVMGKLHHRSAHAPTATLISHARAS